MNLAPAHFFLFFVLAAFIWLAADFLLVQLSRFFAARRAQRKWRDCHLCGKRYPEKPRQKLSKCPGCQALNNKKPHRRLG